MSAAPRGRILVEGTPENCRVAILEEGRLVEYFPASGEGATTQVGDIFRGSVSKLAPGVEAAFVDIGLDTDAFLPQSEWPEAGLRSGETVLVQIQKDAVGGKGARVTTRLALAGRYLVFLPGGVRVRISKRIPEGAERGRLEALGEEILAAFPGDGLILRTNSQGVSAEDLGEDVAQLQRTARQVHAKARVAPVPSRVYREAGPAARVVRDHLTAEIEAVLVSSQALRDEVTSAATTAPPELLGRIRVEPEPFRAAAVDRALERALQPKVYLRSGGHVVIEPTEALTSVDVNSGGSKGGRDLEATALATNLEACEVFARQIRLRDLGGILVVDFIDMAEEANRDRVQAALEAALRPDKGNPKVHGWADLGLMIVSRRRRRMPLFRMLTESCDRCHGRGRVDAPARVAEKAARACEAYLRKNPGQALSVRVHSDLAPAVRERLGDHYERVTVRGEKGFPAHRFQVEPEDRGA